MIDRFIHSRFQIIFLLTVVVLACSGLQAASATQLLQTEVCTIVKTGGCHLSFAQAKPTPCCLSRACHQTLPIQRNLGCPEYHNQQTNNHPLVQESRTFTPQLKVGQALTAAYIPANKLRPLKTLQHQPLQSLDNLRSVVLRH